MNLSTDDLENCIEKFRNVLYKQNENKINENDMWSLLENLIKELEISKENEDTIKKNFTSHLEITDTTITTKYVSLEDKLKHYENEIYNLKSEVKDLHDQLGRGLETQKNYYLNKMSETEEYFKAEITNLKNKMESDKICYETKEKSLFNELQLAQAATALQCDEIESSLKRQLVDANSKLRQSQNLIRNFQIHINDLKNQLAGHQCKRSPEKYTVSEMKYDPLPLMTNSTKETADVEIVSPPTRYTPSLIYKGITSIPRGKNILPPLKPCTQARNYNREFDKNKTIQKKRKLYNPDDASYLNQLEKINSDKIIFD